jgi:hypothetical protein
LGKKGFMNGFGSLKDDISGLMEVISGSDFGSALSRTEPPE